MWNNQGHNGRVPLVSAVLKIWYFSLIKFWFSQSHSTLNMFHKADDIKSNLMLTTLSYIDWYRPIFVYLENVPGFLSHALNATQATKHRVEGGIKMGGLKLVVRALTEMGYVHLR